MKQIRTAQLRTDPIDTSRDTGDSVLQGDFSHTLRENS